MDSKEFIERVTKILAVYEHESTDIARGLEEELAEELKGSPLLENPAVLNVHLDLEFLVHETGNTSVAEVREGLAVLAASLI